MHGNDEGKRTRRVGLRREGAAGEPSVYTGGLHQGD